MLAEIAETLFLQRSRSLFLPHFEEEALFWVINLSNIHIDEINAAKSFLDQETLNKANRLNLEEDRNRKILAYAVLRMYLGRIVGQNPKEIQILYTELGKPYLLGNPVYFNLSHTKEYALFAIHPNKSIGVDIEKIQNNLALLEIAKTFFFPSEKEQVIKAPIPLDHFFSIWSGKEAFLKAIGTGFINEQLPCLELMENSGEIEIYIAQDHKIHIYNYLIENHKVAVCFH